MSNEVSKKEFLKRYLENEEESSRKRKKKPKVAKSKANVPCLKIVNEDIDIKFMNFGEKADDEDEDEAPVVAEVIDDRPEEIKLQELYDSSRWKKIDSSEHLQEGIVRNRRHDSDDDLSPLREQKKTGSVNASSQSHKQNKKRHDSDSDVSPPRNSMQSRSKHKGDGDFSPLQNHRQSRNKSNSDSDLSPQRKQNVNKYNSGSDLSPPRNRKQSRSKHNSDSDLSPPRNQKQRRSKHNSDSDLSPPRNQKQSRNKHNSNSDISSRQNKKQNKSSHNSDCALSPPHSHKVTSIKNLQKTPSHDKNFTKIRHDSDDDLSPLREPKKHLNASAFSPQRPSQNKNRHDSDKDLSPSRSFEFSSAKGKNKLDKTLSGLKAGLQNSKSMQKEVQELRNREKSQLNMLGDEISGRNADTIIRDRKTGKKRDLDKEQETKNEDDKKNKAYLQKYEKWGKGTETRDEHLEKLKDEIHEMSKPLARYEDDADLDERLRSIIHDDDPMSAYMKKKKQKEEGISDYPVYKGPPAPPNRFSIKPGYRWDGVDRSNGFEKKYFEKINHTKAVKDEAYLWSVQDM